MSCCVCILHSSGVSCSPELLSQAAYGVSAMFHSLQTCSADFIPSVAVLHANPIEGVRYAYTSCVNDVSHDAEAEDEDNGAAEQVRNDALRKPGLAARFRGRSVLCLQQAILRCDVAGDNTKNEGSKNVDVWRCFTGALLTACGFLRARVVGNTPSEAASIGSTTAPSARGYLMVFSDVCDAPALSFASECSFSAAALLLARLHATVHAFGRATLCSVVGSRLQALTRSTGGLCASQFALSHVGYMLDGDVAETLPHDDNVTDRQAQERLVERYVVRPVNLPQGPSSMFNADESNTSYLAWLCPSCMTVMVRHPWEDEAVRNCPYCSLTDGADEDS
ncbi:hypothetical protein MOQ_003393 [Trypanosoma cruzi marinkellei]|uniref:TFIIH basal transcription factor subunit n=1 Tax=Trypanosoma cruzi marinkellei TaxID=85056 RepID=K2NCZ8_TRYCR|nr:hypothetical protein MOQ_003393 [Trypanosoma cruzi marinkellei]